jgi:hypothetical protein
MPAIRYNSSSYRTGSRCGGRNTRCFAGIGGTSIFMVRLLHWRSGWLCSRPTKSQGNELAKLERGAAGGLIGGAYSGYNWQIGGVVLGLESDFEGSSLSKVSGPVIALYTAASSTGGFRRARASALP